MSTEEERCRRSLCRNDYFESWNTWSGIYEAVSKAKGVNFMSVSEPHTIKAKNWTNVRTRYWTADSKWKSAQQRERLVPYPTVDYWMWHRSANWFVDSELWEYIFLNSMFHSLPWRVNRNSGDHGIKFLWSLAFHGGNDKKKTYHWTRSRDYPVCPCDSFY